MEGHSHGFHRQKHGTHHVEWFPMLRADNNPWCKVENQSRYPSAQEDQDKQNEAQISNFGTFIFLSCFWKLLCMFLDNVYTRDEEVRSLNNK